MKNSIRISLLAVIIAISGTGYSQTISWEYPDSVFQDKRLYRWEHGGVFKHEKSIGIVPSIQGINDMYLGIGVSKAKFAMGEGAGSGFGTTVGVDYNPSHKIIAPKVNLWATGFVFFLGGNVGITGFYYIKDQESNFVLRPEIGIGFLKVFINYGYNLFLRNDFEGVSNQTLTLSYYHTFLPFRQHKKGPYQK